MGFLHFNGMGFDVSKVSINHQYFFWGWFVIALLTLMGVNHEWNGIEPWIDDHKLDLTILMGLKLWDEKQTI